MNRDKTKAASSYLIWGMGIGGIRQYREGRS